MENFIVPLIVCITVWGCGYLTGTIRARRHIAQFMADDPDSLIEILNNIKHLNEEGEELDEGTEVSIDCIDQKVFVYNKKTNLFLGQGKTVEDALMAVGERFPGQKFWYYEDINDSTV